MPGASKTTNHRARLGTGGAFMECVALRVCLSYLSGGAWTADAHAHIFCTQVYESTVWSM